MAPDLTTTYDRLYSYCEREGFAGYDPFDGLNSRLFQATPFKYSRVARLAWTQGVKRSPVDLRRLLMVEKGVNPKALALFALAELARLRASGDERHAANARMQIGRLLETKIEGVALNGKPTLAFGYNFDWQSRVFYAPRGTPAIVPTAFAQAALIQAFDAFGDEEYLAPATAICRFVVNDLNRPVETDDEICFSYTPQDNSIVYNASLLAGECLARVGGITESDKYSEMAVKTVRFALQTQRADGSWPYGAGEKQGWVDNFHTAYVLLSLFRISGTIESLRSATFDALQRGTAYWVENFFLDDGTPKYYDSDVYPIDTHSGAVAIATLCELSPIDDRMLPMAYRTTEWMVGNMRDAKGYFYYQKRANRTINKSFMRWSQAWMAYALARLIEAGQNGK